MHDTLEYFQTPPDERPLHRGKLLFSMEYFPNERYLCSPCRTTRSCTARRQSRRKMWGADLRDKYAQARAFYLYMFAHPGKKLNFMGNELGLRTEWNEAAALDWTYADGPFHLFFRVLCQTYCAHPALHCDYAADSFRWLPADPDAPLRVCLRAPRRGGETLLAVCNFADEPYAFAAPAGAALVLHTDWPQFGGDPDAAAPADRGCSLTPAPPSPPPCCALPHPNPHSRPAPLAEGLFRQTAPCLRRGIQWKSPAARSKAALFQKTVERCVSRAFPKKRGHVPRFFIKQQKAPKTNVFGAFCCNSPYRRSLSRASLVSGCMPETKPFTAPAGSYRAGTWMRRARCSGRAAAWSGAPDRCRGRRAAACRTCAAW